MKKYYSFKYYEEENRIEIFPVMYGVIPFVSYGFGSGYQQNFKTKKEMLKEISKIKNKKEVKKCYIQI